MLAFWHILVTAAHFLQCRGNSQHGHTRLTHFECRDPFGRHWGKTRVLSGGFNALLPSIPNSPSWLLSLQRISFCFLSNLILKTDTFHEKETQYMASSAFGIQLKLCRATVCLRPRTCCYMNMVLHLVNCEDDTPLCQMQGILYSAASC